MKATEDCNKESLDKAKEVMKPTYNDVKKTILISLVSYFIFRDPIKDVGRGIGIDQLGNALNAGDSYNMNFAACMASKGYSTLIEVPF